MSEQAAALEPRRELRYPSVDDLRQAGVAAVDIEEATPELRRGPEFFRERVMALNPPPGARVLDAACGIGTWSLALASEGRFVTALDVNMARVRIGRDLQQANQVEGVAFLGGSVHELPFRDGVFDMVLCNGALMFVRPDHAVSELARVLKPGGLLYLTANGIGWYLVELPWRALRRRRLVYLKGSVVCLARALVKWTLGRDLPLTAFTRSEVVRLLERHGVQPLIVCDEGRGQAPGAQVSPRPAYRGRYIGLNGIFEVIGRKC